jgi:hypothetical protein
MRRLYRPFAGLAFMCAAVAAPMARQSAPVFKATGNGVLVDVSVSRGKVPAPDLKAADFELLDSGVRQNILDASLEKSPVDLSLLVDVSESQRSTVDAQRSLVQALSEHITPPDSVQLIRVASGFSEMRTPSDLWVPLEFEQRHTALLDALAAVLKGLIGGGL